jgi:hypothetical protein
LAEFYFTVLLTLLNIALPYTITHCDRKNLGPLELARAWNTPSWACAIYFFGPLSLPAHFFVTRRTLRGFALGALWTVVVLTVEWLAGFGIESLSA